MVSRQWKSSFRITGVAGIVASGALAVFIAQQVIASCVTKECVQTSCRKTTNPTLCTEFNLTTAFNIYHTTSLPGSPQLFNPVQRHGLRIRGSCTISCDPPKYPSVAACAGSGGNDDFTGTIRRRYCGSATS